MHTQATGVPLVDVLMKCKTVEAAAQFSIKLVAASVGAVMLGRCAVVVPAWPFSSCTPAGASMGNDCQGYGLHALALCPGTNR